MSDSVRPHRRQPTRLPRPWDSPGKNTGVGCHFLLQCMKLKSESEVTQSSLTASDPMDCSLPGSSVHGIHGSKFCCCSKGVLACVVAICAHSPNISWFLFLIMEKAMAPHSSTLAWKIPWMEEPSRLQSMGLLRVGHD